MTRSTMARLRPGKGAKGSILTRFIKPKQVHNGDQNHRSDIKIVGRFANNKGTEYYRFKYYGDNSEEEESNLMTGTARFVKIVEEGEERDIFVGAAPPLDVEHKEPTTKWADSNARKILHQDIYDGKVDKDTPPEEVYAMHPEYAEYDFENFPSRFKSLLKIVEELDNRAEVDEEAFQNFVSNHKSSISKHTFKGYPQWKGSNERKLAIEDIKNDLHKENGFRWLWSSRDGVYKVFPFEAFRDKCKQEIKTSKYIHYLKENGKTQRLGV